MTAQSIDQAQIRTVVINLLGNSLKFTKIGGTIRITLNLKSINNIPTLELQIRDTGHGIPEEDLEIIFEPFVQSTQANDTTKGSGLGLAICRNIVIAHGGTIVASNHIEGGAIMTILLPIPYIKTNPGSQFHARTHRG